MESVTVHSKGPQLLIADDHAMFSEALRVYLEKTHTVVGLVRDGHAMVAEAMRRRPDVIVVDVCMPLLNGLDAARKINLQAPSIKFVFLTMRDDPNLAAANKQSCKSCDKIRVETALGPTRLPLQDTPMKMP